jgi:hypothetical protein
MTYIPRPYKKAEEHNLDLLSLCCSASTCVSRPNHPVFSFFPALVRPSSPPPTPRPRPSFFSARRRSFFSARPASPRLALAAPGRRRPALPRAKSSARRRSFFNARPALPRPAPAAPGWRCLGRAPLTPAGAALPVRLGPGPSCCCCAHQPGLQPVPPHPSTRAPISPATVAPIRPGSGWRRPTLAHPGCAPAAPASAAPTRFFFLLVCFFFFQALFFTLLCSIRWL